MTGGRTGERRLCMGNEKQKNGTKLRWAVSKRQPALARRRPCSVRQQNHPPHPITSLRSHQSSSRLRTVHWWVSIEMLRFARWAFTDGSRRFQSRWITLVGSSPALTLVCLRTNIAQYHQIFCSILGVCTSFHRIWYLSYRIEVRRALVTLREPECMIETCL